MLNQRMMNYILDDDDFMGEPFLPNMMPFDQGRPRPFPVRRDPSMMIMQPIPEPEMPMGSAWPYAPPQPYMVMVPPAPQMEMFPPMTNEFAGVPIVRPLHPPRREFDLGGLSVHAKPWNPMAGKPPITPTQVKPNDLRPSSWTRLIINGKEISAPGPFIWSSTKSNLFIHSTIVKPWEKPTLEFELYNYFCARCSIKTLFTKLSSRKSDVAVYNVAQDVPPLCITHLLEQISKVRIIAVSVSESNGYHLNMWLDKPTLASQVVSSLTDNIWICPMFHGYAVMPKNAEAKDSLKKFLETCKSAPEASKSAYPLSFIEVKEHQEKQKGGKKQSD